MKNFFPIILMLLSGSVLAETCNLCLSGNMLSDEPLIAKTFKKYGYKIDPRSGDRPYCANLKAADYSLQFDWIPCGNAGTPNCGYAVHNTATGKSVTEIRKGTNGEYEQIINGHRTDQLVRKVLALLKPRGADLSCGSDQGVARANNKSKEISTPSSSGSSGGKESDVKSTTP